MYLSKRNLELHRLVNPEDPRAHLRGIFVDPRKGKTVASDGSCLVEITSPSKVSSDSAFKAPGIVLANGEARPFILPADAAKEILQSLPKGKKDSEAVAALAVSKVKGKLAIVTSDGKKATPIHFAPIADDYPDLVKAEIFPTSKPLASILVDSENLAATMRAAALGKSGMTLHVFKDRVVVQSKDDGLEARAVQMGLRSAPATYVQQPAAQKPEPKREAAKTEPEKPAESTCAEAPKAEATKPIPRCMDCDALLTDSTSPYCDDCAELCADQGEAVAAKGMAVPVKVSTRQGGGSKKAGAGSGNRSNRRWKSRKDTSEPIAVGASNAQRAFYLYLLRHRGEGRTIIVNDLLAEKVSEKIEALLALPAKKNTSATWFQWRKLFLTLVDRKVDHNEICEILNGLTDIQSTSSVIAEWAGQKSAETVAAEAA